MPRPHPPEFRQRAVELARLREKPVAQIAEDLGISEVCLRSWMAQADVDDGRRPGLTSDERAELVAAAPREAGARDGERDPQACRRLLRQGERPPKMIYAFIVERCADLPVEQCVPRDEGVEVGVLRLAAPRRRTRPSGWLADAELGELIVKIHDAVASAPTAGGG